MVLKLHSLSKLLRVAEINHFKRECRREKLWCIWMCALNHLSEDFTVLLRTGYNRYCADMIFTYIVLNAWSVVDLAFVEMFGHH